MSQTCDEPSYDFDLVVIGGGSGGISAARRARELGARVALCDYVSPSPQGSKWGLGGTCVNVGCIPKKIMHTSALLGEHLSNMNPAYGWPEVPTKMVDWDTLRDNTQEYIHSLNFGYRSDLRGKGVTYLNAKAQFTDPHTITLLENEYVEKKSVSAKYFVLATGGRPTLLPIPGVEHAVTSDDIFMLPREPGHTLIIGGSYVALECAGFLTGIGRPTTVMYRSVPLRMFDQQMAGRIVHYMKDHGTSFLEQCVPLSIEKDPATGKLHVKYVNTTTKKESVGTYNTVMFATGRAPEVSFLKIESLGVKLSQSGKIIVDAREATSVPHIFALGDVIEGGIELTPVAIMAGRLLSNRLFGGSSEKMNYLGVPSAVFTPIEYGFVGLSEEEAEKKFGIVDVYHSSFQPLEWALPHLDDNACYMKMIVNPFDSNRIVGFHLLSPNAGEIVQGVAVALIAGATKEHFDRTVGIHPTVAEAMTTLKVTKASGENFEKTGC